MRLKSQVLRYISISVIMRYMNDSNTKTPQNIGSFNPNLKSVLGEIEEGHYTYNRRRSKKGIFISF